MAAKAKTIQKPFEVRSVPSFGCPPANGLMPRRLRVVEQVPVREFLGAPAVVVAGTDQLVQVCLMSFAILRPV